MSEDAMDRFLNKVYTEENRRLRMIIWALGWLVVIPLVIWALVDSRYVLLLAIPIWLYGGGIFLLADSFDGDF